MTITFPAPRISTADDELQHLKESFAAQAKAFHGDSNPDRRTRGDRLHRLGEMVKANRQRIIEAVASDFGTRAAEEIRLTEIAASLAQIDYARKNLRRWMRPRRRSTSIWFLPGSGRVICQPLGVVGVMAPWNLPFNLALAPAVAAIAAGNRVIIKMSEAAPATGELTRAIVRERMDETELSVVLGAADVAQAFADLPWNHLLFTGSTSVGRKVALAAARNLVPVTLELGGKSPVIVDRDFPIEEAAKRVAWGKAFNAGQICVAPDYAFVPREKVHDFAQAFLAQGRRYFPGGIMDDAYTSIIDERGVSRLEGLLGAARQMGAEVLSLGEMTDVSRRSRKIPLSLVIDPPRDSSIMTNEIFGPLLVVLGYDKIDEAIAFIRSRENPLGLYYFGHDKATRGRILSETLSGGVAINDVMLQYLQVDLPFGGVGASGIGRYHGTEGFDTFSHHRAVFTQRGPLGVTGLKFLYPPYGAIGKRLISMMGG
ncbi:aldehyde dehydrogenase family protein [Oleomonas cavernae]|uniref:aldehyde dehydrogenase family protein n=1 Tax=Oleomonas cavernae TaxID=2320859 RepID=UPI00131471E2|nr:aldehyde dehydrogenase family protein [Oleomonas cavernae]